MDDEVDNTKVKKMSPQRSTSVNGVNAVTLRISGSLVTMAMLLWAIRSGFKLAKDSNRYIGYTDWAFRIGVVTMLLGFMFLLLGIPILADLFLNLSEQLQEEAGIHKAKDTKTISKVTAGIFAIIITLIVLGWAIYTGLKLATNPRWDGKYNFLTTSIGVLTVIFGFIYFVIGVNIIAELGLDLFEHMQQKKKKRSLLSSRLKK